MLAKNVTKNDKQPQEEDKFKHLKTKKLVRFSVTQYEVHSHPSDTTQTVALGYFCLPVKYP